MSKKQRQCSRKLNWKYCTQRMNYLRFRKLTFEVKLLLKLEKFSVPVFSCFDRKWKVKIGYYILRTIGGRIYALRTKCDFGLTCGAQIRPQPTFAIVLILTYATETNRKQLTLSVAVFDSITTWFHLMQLLSFVFVLWADDLEIW